MKHGKYQNRGAAKRGAGKSIAVVLVLVLVLGCAIGGTIAWLTDKTDEVQNTFTVGDINIDLTETGTDANGKKNYDIVPGDTETKDPKVTVEANSEACWLFVKVIETNNLEVNVIGSDPVTKEKVLQYSVITGTDGWTKLDGVDNVYYREVDAATAKAGVSYYVLTNNQVKISENVTKSHFDTLTANKPTLTFTAYAIQSANLADQDNDGNVDAADAWELVNK